MNKLVLVYRKCSTCIKALNWLEENNIESDLVYLGKQPIAGCIACGKCEKACTQHLPIIERMKEIASL